MPELDDTWDQLIHRCLERDPKERLTDARRIVSILEGEDSQPKGKKWGHGSWWPF